MKSLTQEEIKEIFGNFTPYLTKEGIPNIQWETDKLTSFKLPAPMNYGLIKVTRTRCHIKIKEHLKAALTDCYNIPEVWDTINDYGGCYNFRLQRKSTTSLSTHCWGISIDIDVADNPFGRNPRVNPKIIEIFREHGFLWGGNFPLKRRDGMHFEFFDLRKL